MHEGSLLMIAYHVPPCAEVSGAVRTLAFARYLRETGLQTMILAPSVRAYPKILETSPPCEITRAFALDSRRHLGLGGRFPELLALPDRWISWWPGAVAKGLKWIKRHRPLAIWSTYPIATAHLIAYTLHHRTGIPWIADFRDPLTASYGQEQTLTARSRAWVEHLTLATANACVFVTPGAREWYAQRYDGRAQGELLMIPNGYDEEAFAGLSAVSRSDNGRFTLVHSGVLYPKGRNPEPFFSALAHLLRNSCLDARKLRVVLRACGSEARYRPMLQQYGLERVVELAPTVSREAALREQYTADALLLFQGTEFNRQIPAKVYEYFRVGRPVLALADPAGETARLITATSAGRVLPIDDSEALVTGLPEFITDVARGAFEPMKGAALHSHSRRAGAAELQALIGRLK